jgi:hypothetical protein
LVYKSKIEQERRLEAVLTGNDDKAKKLRQLGSEKIKYFNLPENVKPEKYIHDIIINLDTSDNDEWNEIVGLAKQIIVVDDSHKYVNDIINKLDWDRGSGLSKIIDLVQNFTSS